MTGNVFFFVVQITGSDFLKIFRLEMMEHDFVVKMFGRRPEEKMCRQFASGDEFFATLTNNLENIFAKNKDIV